MEFMEIIMKFVLQVVASAVGIYIAYLIIKRWEKHHGNRSTPKSE